MDEGTEGDKAISEEDVTQDSESSQGQFARYLNELVSRYFESQDTLATRVGVSPSTVTAWLKGKNVPGTRKQAMRIAEVLREQLRKQDVDFNYDEFMQLWDRANAERRQRQGIKPPKQPPEMNSPPKPDFVPPVEDATTRAIRPDIGDPELNATVDLEAGVLQSVDTPPAPDISVHDRRRSLLIPLLVVVAVVASLLYVAVRWVSGQQPGAPAYPRPSSKIGTTSPISQVNVIYSTNADEAKGAHVHELLHGGSVDQQFRAVTPKIVRLAAIIGRSDFADRAKIGRVRFELLDCTTVPVTHEVDAFNNVDTVVTLDPPVSVNQGQMCTLRVTNLEQARTLSFYFNRNPNPETQTVLHGAVDPPGASAPHEHDLSGHVLGQGP